MAQRILSLSQDKATFTPLAAHVNERYQNSAPRAARDSVMLRSFWACPTRSRVLRVVCDMDAMTG